MDASESPKRVCIVCCGPTPSTIEYAIFIVDLNLASGNEMRVTVMDPTVRLDSHSFHDSAFCVLGSTLYVFTGYDYESSPQTGQPMFMYQLPEGISNLKLDKDMLTEGPSTYGVKVSPKAAVTPSGMIIVFSSVINIPTPLECDFELYDPINRIWHKLPSLCPPHPHPDGHYFWITSYTIMEKNVLLVRTEEFGDFMLDITPPQPPRKTRTTQPPTNTWKASGYLYPEFLISYPGTSLVLIGEDICMIPYSAYTISKPGVPKDDPMLHYSFPNLYSFPHYEYSAQSGGIALLEDHGVTTPDFSVCFLHSGQNEATKTHELVLQVYHCNRNKCTKQITEYRQKKTVKEMMMEMNSLVLPATTEVGSLKIVVTDVSSYNLGLCTFSYIPVELPCRKSSRKQRKI